VFRDALEQDPDPADLAVFLDALFGAWGVFFGVSLTLMVALAFTGDQIAGDAGNVWGLAIGAFPVGFCLVGEFVTSWRLKCARRARRFARSDSAVDKRALDLIRKARANDGGQVLQVFGGIIASVLASVSDRNRARHSDL